VVVVTYPVRYYRKLW